MCDVASPLYDAGGESKRKPAAGASCEAHGNRAGFGPLSGMAKQPPRKTFDEPVRVLLAGESVTVASVDAAVERLAHVDWPERGPRHRDAYDTCLKALDGHRTSDNARREFIEAAREAGILSES